MNRELQLVNNLNLEPGDRVIVPKSLFGIITRHFLPQKSQKKCLKKLNSKI